MKPYNHPVLNNINTLMDRVELLIKTINVKKNLGKKYEFISNKELMELFDVNSPTATRWRDSGELPFFKIERKIYYKIEDIKIFIDSKYFSKKN